MHEQETFSATDLNLRKLGQTCTNFWEMMLRQASDDLEHLGPGDVSHVAYTDTVKDPVGTVKKLYKALNLEYTAEFDGESIRGENVDLLVIARSQPRARRRTSLSLI